MPSIYNKPIRFGRTQFPNEGMRQIYSKIDKVEETQENCHICFFLLLFLFGFIVQIIFIFLKTRGISGIHEASWYLISIPSCVFFLIGLIYLLIRKEKDPRIIISLITLLLFFMLIVTNDFVQGPIWYLVSPLLLWAVVLFAYQQCCNSKSSNFPMYFSFHMW